MSRLLLGRRGWGQVRLWWRCWREVCLLLLLLLALELLHLLLVILELFPLPELLHSVGWELLLLLVRWRVLLDRLVSWRHIHGNTVRAILIRRRGRGA